MLSTSTTTDRILEIGAGTIALEKISKSAISSDIAIADGISCVLSASEIPFPNDTFRAVVAQNVFHHLPDHRTALTEISRVLQTGGILVVIEPYFGKFAQLIFPALFAFEGFDLDAELGTECVLQDGQPIPNQAASYIVFEREWHHFESTFPNLKKIHASPIPSGLRYLLTGGLNFRQLAPTRLLKLLRRIEQTRFGKKTLQRLALHWVVVLHYQPLTQSTSEISGRDEID